MREKSNTNDRLAVVRKAVTRTEPPTAGEGIRLAVHQCQGRVGDRAAMASLYDLRSVE